MLPTCYYLESTAARTRLYLGEVSTEECLRVFDPAEVVVVSELGANVPGDGWFDQDDLPRLGSVAAVLSFLRARKDIELIDFSAQVGQVRLSTHDDSEAQLDFTSTLDALEFLRRSLEADVAERAIHALLEHPAKYVVLSKTLYAFETFEEYVAATNSSLHRT